MKYLAEIKKFKDTLIKSDIRDQIAKVVWFGSTLRNRPRKESDVDVLIVGTDGNLLRDRIADILLDFQTKAEIPLELVISTIDELYPLVDPFLKNVLAYGQEVYSMPEKKLKRLAARNQLPPAQEYYDASADTFERDTSALPWTGPTMRPSLPLKDCSFSRYRTYGALMEGWPNVSVNFTSRPERSIEPTAVD